MVPNGNPILKMNSFPIPPRNGTDTTPTFSPRPRLSPCFAQGTGSSGPHFDHPGTLGARARPKEKSLSENLLELEHTHDSEVERKRDPRILVLDYSFADLATPRHEVERGPENVLANTGSVERVQELFGSRSDCVHIP